MESRDILYEKRDRVALATLNRPEVLNAFRDATVQRLLDILQDAAQDELVRVLVLTGAGRAFSAGHDLQQLAADLERGVDRESARQGLETLQSVTRRLVSHPKVVIAAVNGLTVGMGVEIAIAADIRLAAEGAWFQFAEAKRALFHTNGILYLLPRLVGYGRAMEMLLTGERITARAALQAGLVTHVTPPAGLMDEALRLARIIAGNAPVSLQLLKAAMRRTYDLDLEAVMRLEVEGMMACLDTEDIVEGTRAFQEHRPPVYRGR